MVWSISMEAQSSVTGVDCVKVGTLLKQRTALAAHHILYTRIKGGTATSPPGRISNLRASTLQRAADDGEIR